MRRMRNIPKGTYVFAAAALIYIVFASNLPITLMFPAAHDDALYWKQGYLISNGEWLGSYDNKTLLRGQAFAIFLAISSFLHLSVTFSLALLHVLAFSVVFISIPLHVRNHPLLVSGISLALFHPGLFPQRAIRDYFFASVVVIAFGLAFLLVRVWQNRRRRNLLAIALGLTLGVAWLTREESIILLPGILLVATTGLFIKGPVFWKRALTFMSVSALALASFSLPQIAIAQLNKTVYGVELTSERGSENFSKVMGTLYSINLPDQKPYVPVPQKTLEKLYALSPKFAELRPFLQGDGVGWQRPGCADFPSTCGEFAAGWLEFAIRDAAQAAGHYATASNADRYYQELAAELESVCERGSITCGPRGYSLIPWLSQEQITAVPGVFANAILKGLSWAPGAALQGPEQLGGSDTEMLRSFLGNPSVSSSIFATGWYVPKSREDWLGVECETTSVSLNRDPSPDLAEHFKDESLSANRFSINLNQANSNCSISNKMQTFTLPLKEEMPPSFSTDSPGGLITLDHFKINKNPVGDFTQNLWTMWNAAYCIISPLAILIGFALSIIAAFKKKSRRSEEYFFPLIFMAAITITVIIRLVMLSIIEVSMFHSLFDIYLQPVYALVSIIPVLCVAQFLTTSD